MENGIGPSKYDQRIMQEKNFFENCYLVLEKAGKNDENEP
jgi:hypothetical protein